MEYIKRLHSKALYNEKGLTVIEMIVVILIIAVLASIAVAAFESWKTAKIETTAQHFGQIFSASLQYIGRHAHPDFASINNAAIQPYISGLNLTGGVPWGGDYTVSPLPTNFRILQVTARNIPDEPGAEIAAKLNSRGWTASFGSSTVTATRGL